MSHPERAANPSSESIVDLLLKFFPGTGEIVAFAGGIAIGAGILGVLAMIAFGIGGQHGITPTF